MSENLGKTETSGESGFRRVVRELEAFGHRGSATAQEDRAADYLIGELRRRGVEGVKEPFVGYTSLGARVLIHVILAALGMLFIWKWPLVTVLVGAVVLVSYVGEMTTRFRLLSRVLPSSPSRNVVGVMPARGGGATKRVVVSAHMDTQRTGLIWRGKFTRQVAHLYQKLPGAMKSPLFPVMAAFALQPLAGVLTWAWPGSTVATVVTVYVFIIYAVSGFLLAEWSVGPFVPGAADNATGVAAALELADRWRQTPADGVDLVLLLSGCEETGPLGAAAWVEAHLDERPRDATSFLVLDTLSCGAPRFVDAEYTLAATRVHYHADMIRLAGDVARRLGLRDAGPHALPTFTDAIPFARRGIGGVSILTFEDGVYMPNYHQLVDTSDRVDFGVAWQAVEFSWEVLKELARRKPDSA